jgi:phosphoglycerate dehydrogenase-like enzyme
MPNNSLNFHLSEPKIAVTSSSFGKSKILREELKKSFQKCFYNELGRPLTELELIEFIKDADAAVVGTEIMTENVLNHAPRLKIISKYGVGLDNIDKKLLEKYGIFLGWTGGINRRSVAELTLCFMLGLCRNIFAAGFKLKQSTWEKNGGYQLTGKTIGIIGCGYTGSEVIRLLRPFQCTILISDIVDKSNFCKSENAIELPLEDVVTRSNIISFHVPLTSLTKEMVNTNLLAKMKSNAFLINTSRGGIVDQQALKGSLKANRIAGAALDVFSEEPPNDQELLSLSNLMVTPHIAGNAQESVEAMGRSAIGHLISYFKNQ